MIFLFKCGGEIVGIVVAHEVGNLFQSQVGGGEQLLAALQPEFLQVLQGRIARVLFEKTAELGIAHADVCGHVDGPNLLTELFCHDDLCSVHGRGDLLVLEGVVTVESEGVALQRCWPRRRASADSRCPVPGRW